jgi:hypothetical protein
MQLNQAFFAASLIVASLMLGGCHNDELSAGGEPTGPVAVGDTVAITSTSRVISFNRVPGPNLSSDLSIKGLKNGESLLGIDTRPNDQLIYTVSNQANIYTLAPSTGQLSFKAALSAGAATTATCSGGAPGDYTGLQGTEFALDFNPAADRMRLVSDTGQDLRINVDTGAVTVDCPITFASGSGTPKPTSAAYNNSVPMATSTDLFYIDTNTDTLYAIDKTDSKNANNGVLTPVGALGVDAGDINGFDIEGLDKGYAVLTVTGSSGTRTGFYSINISTGAATALALFAQDYTLRGLALR